MDNLKSILTKTKDNSSFTIVFGEKLFEECFNFCFSEENYINFLRFIKNQEKWELISKKNIKIFYYYDLQLKVDDEGNMNLEKNIVSKYFNIINKDNQGIRLINYKKIDNMDLNIFPGLDKIHDIRKIREIIFKKDDMNIKFMVVNHSNKDITFEIYLEFNNKCKNINDNLKNITGFLQYKNLSIIEEVEIKNVDNLSISII